MNRKFKILLAVCGTAFMAVLFMFSPFFYMKEVSVKGCERIPVSEVLERSGVNGTTNVLLLNTAQTRARLMENMYIDDVVFERRLPGQLIITIRERHLSGYVEYMQGKFLYIDENGRVLEINSYYTEKLPVVSGLKFDKVRLGDLLDVEDKTAFKTVVSYARLFNKHQMTDQVSRIDMSDSSNTRIHLYHIEFNVGDGKNAEEKVRTIKEIIEKLPNSEVLKGFVDLKEIREHYFLKILM